MPPTVINLLEKRFGKLTVIEFDGTKKYGSSKRAMWICRCDCGNMTTVESGNLRNGKVVGCGKCRSNIVNQYGKYDLKSYDSTFNYFYRMVRDSAKNRHLAFSLSMDDVRKISQKSCHYCGVSPKQVVKSRNNYDADFIYNGIDRVDNTRGYELDNIVPCCKKCNQAKMNLTVAQFKGLIVSIYKNWARK